MLYFFFIGHIISYRSTHYKLIFLRHSKQLKAAKHGINNAMAFCAPSGNIDLAYNCCNTYRAKTLGDNTMNSKKIHIDPQEFAYHFVDSISKGDVSKANMQTKAKEQLFAYLTAYVLIEQFNTSEASEFLDDASKKVEDLSMKEFLRLVSQRSDFSPLKK